MRGLSGCGLALAASLSLAACGGGDSTSGRAPTLGEIRELAGLSAPVETPEAALARGLDVFGRADSLILSTMHGETGDAEVPTFRLLTQCGGSRCTVTEPLSGTVDTIDLADTPLRQGAATAIGSKHGIALFQESSGHTGADLASLGAWMEHSTFAVLSESQTGEDGTVGVRYGIALGELAGTAPGPIPGSATWLGLMVGTPVSGDVRGERLVGDAALTYDFPSWVGAPGPSLDVAFGGIRNIDRGTAHGGRDGVVREPRGRTGRDLREGRVRRAHPGRLLRSRPRRGGGHLRAVRHRRRVRREAAVGAPRGRRRGRSGGRPGG